jgi:hypothetical protein
MLNFSMTRQLGRHVRAQLCHERNRRSHDHPDDCALERKPGVTRQHRSKKEELFMWKVESTEDSGLVVLVVSGRIEGENLAELREVFTAKTGNQNFILDMSEVRLVDQDSIDFLSRYEANGAVLRNCPAYIREWIERDRETENSY